MWRKFDKKVYNAYDLNCFHFFSVERTLPYQTARGTFKNFDFRYEFVFENYFLSKYEYATGVCVANVSSVAIETIT